MEDQMNGIQGAVSQLTQANQEAVNDDLEKRKKLLKDYLNQPPPDSQIPPVALSQALAQLGDNSKPAQVGKAISSDKSWANLCEAYAETQIYGKRGMYPDAISAYQANAQNNNIDTSTKFTKGAQLFFNADSSNGGNGHTAVAINNKEFVAPLSDGSIKKFTLPEWLKYSGQQYLGFAPPPSK